MDLTTCFIGGLDPAIESRVVLYPAGCGNGPLQACNPIWWARLPAIASPALWAYSERLPVSSSQAAARERPPSWWSMTARRHRSATRPSMAVQETGPITIPGSRSPWTALEMDLSREPHSSSDLPISGAQVTNYNATASSIGASNVFVAEFATNAEGKDPTLLYSTYLGGSGAALSSTSNNINLAVGDAATAIAYDSDDNTIWLTGYTASPDFQVPGQASTVYQSQNNAASTAGVPGDGPIGQNWIPILRGQPVFSTRPTSAVMDSPQRRSTSRKLLASAMRQPELHIIKAAYTSRE